MGTRNLMLWMLVLTLVGCPHEPIAIPQVEHQKYNTIPDFKTPHQHILKAWYHIHRKEWGLANQWFQQAADQTPTDPWIYIHWGNAAQKLNHTSTASQKWQEAFNLMLPSDVERRRELKQKIEENGDFLE